MVELLVAWLPLLLFLVTAVLIGRHQMRAYRQHVDRVSAINNEVLELNRKNHDLAFEQLKVLAQIKDLLEDRKS